MKQEKTPVRLYSEIGRLNAVLLHRPGMEIEAMTPMNTAHALYQDILNKDIVDEEYRLFSGVLEKCTHTYQV
ncbi:MAG: arginine deiminase, partial [Bacteroidales bacterium]|nr:arginine deiminase [Bacteroidales bacterium]